MGQLKRSVGGRIAIARNVLSVSVGAAKDGRIKDLASAYSPQEFKEMLRDLEELEESVRIIRRAMPKPTAEDEPD